jgi:hypothetical protein
VSSGGEPGVVRHDAKFALTGLGRQAREFAAIAGNRQQQKNRRRRCPDCLVTCKKLSTGKTKYFPPTLEFPGHKTFFEVTLLPFLGRKVN